MATNDLIGINSIVKNLDSPPQGMCSVRELQRILMVSALHQDKLGEDLLSNLLQLCQRLLLPRGLQRYESRVRPRFLQSL